MAIKKRKTTKATSKKKIGRPKKVEAEKKPPRRPDVTSGVRGPDTSGVVGKKKPAKTTAADLISKYRRQAADTGSTEVQIAVLSERIEELAKHLKKHPKDFDSRRGLLILVSKRRKLLNYLRRTDEKQYQKMTVDLKLLQ